ncbi:conserved hypothetical protein [Theileria orientalis strain Shintoku]|uniref:Uncharacterized protein n=1 Tax=Theileria orientalis strain Shintoku TaxID=869250 RepID=J4C8G2_THEOR|nr:conserved hypothetical protein [Theileria orientalis strain Shintoku]BAM40733.1 conserved hypothetical protein [Theileria orientalis strain Shintoku]|eukprot:XP_009691034.1 conserved hypothetical protein [Theileria orientalis strain Shintoku]
MKINTISTYVLVYLLTNGHWNLMVPVKADGGSTGGSDAGSTAGSKAGSTAGSDVAEVSTLEADGTVASPANEGSTSGDANASLATPASGADGSSSASADGTSSSGEDGSSGQAAPATETVLLNGLYPDSYTSGWHVDMVGPDPKLKAKREEARLVAEDVRKTAEKLKKAADKLIKEADQLSEEIEKPYNIDELNAKIDAAVYNVAVERTEAANVSKPLDLTYYDGFPDGHHHRADHKVLEKMYAQHRRANNEMYRDGFPEGWHFQDPVLFAEAEKYREDKYKRDKEAKGKEIDDKRKQIAENEGKIDVKSTQILVKKEEVDEKLEELTEKKQEVTDLKELIKELQKDLKNLEGEARNIASEHSTLNRELIVLDVEKRKLDDEHAKLEGEYNTIKQEDSKLDREYRVVNAKLVYVHGHKWDKQEVYNDSAVYEAHFASAASTVPLPEATVPLSEAKSPVEHKYIGEINPADNFSEHPLFTAHVAAQAKSEAHVAEGSGAAPAVPVPGSTEAKPVEESAEDKAEAAAVPETKPEEAGHVAPPAVETHVTKVDGQAAPPVKHEARTASTGVKFFKEGADGNIVELVENTDYTKKKVTGDDKYEFNASSPCVKVTFDGNEVWKKGDQSVDAPVSVSYRDTYNAIVVRDDTKSVAYKKKQDNTWAYDTTITRAAKTGSGSTAATTMTRTGLASPGMARTATGGSTTNLASASAKLGGSVTNLSAGSTTGSDEGKSTGTEDVANLKEVEEDTSGSGSAGSASTTTLRGSASASPRAH